MRDYEFERLPLNPVRPGTTLLLAGPPHIGTRQFGLQLLDGATDEGAIYVSTDKRAASLLEECQRLDIETTRDRTSVIDAVDDTTTGLDATINPVSGPSDLTGIGMRASDAYRHLHQKGISRVRMGFFSLSTLLLFGTLRNLSRFVHVFASRIDDRDGLGVFHLNPTIHDQRAVQTLSRFCDGRIDIRSGEDGRELRARGLPNQSGSWEPF